MADALSARGCRVWGVEIDPRAANIARQHCVDVVEADVETLDFPGAFPVRRSTPFYSWTSWSISAILRPRSRML